MRAHIILVRPRIQTISAMALGRVAVDQRTAVGGHSWPGPALTPTAGKRNGALPLARLLSLLAFPAAGLPAWMPLAGVSRWRFPLCLGQRRDGRCGGGSGLSHRSRPIDLITLPSLGSGRSGHEHLGPCSASMWGMVTIRTTSCVCVGLCESVSQLPRPCRNF